MKAPFPITASQTVAEDMAAHVLAYLRKNNVPNHWGQREAGILLAIARTPEQLQNSDTAKLFVGLLTEAPHVVFLMERIRSVINNWMATPTNAVMLWLAHHPEAWHLKAQALQNAFAVGRSGRQTKQFPYGIPVTEKIVHNAKERLLQRNSPQGGRN